MQIRQGRRGRFIQDRQVGRKDVGREGGRVEWEGKLRSGGV